MPSKSTKSGLLAVLFLLALLAAFYYPVFFEGKVISPHTMSRWYPWKALGSQPPKDDYGYYTLGDTLNWYYPNHYFVKKNFGLDNIWAWDYYRYTGQPFTYLTPAAYLSTLLFLPDVISGMTFSALLLLMLSGVSMFYFLREMELDLAPSLLGALAYMLNSNSLVFSGFYHELTLLTLMPVVLLFAEKAIKSNRFIYVAPLSLAFMAVLYNGKVQLTVHLMYLLLFYCIFRIFISKGQRSKGAAGRALIILSASAALAALMYLPQAAALYELARHSDRLSKTFDFFAVSKYPPGSLLAMFSLDIFGRPMTNGFWGTGFMLNLVEAYIGPAALVLACASLLDRKRGQTIFWAAAFSVALLLMLSNIPYRLFVDYVPGFNISKGRPAEVVLFSSFILASIGFDNLLKIKDRDVSRAMFKGILAFMCAGAASAFVVHESAPLFEWLRRFLPGITGQQLTGAVRSLLYSFAVGASCSLAALLYLEGKLNRRVFQGALIAFIIMDIFLVNRELRYVQEPSDVYRTTGGIEFLKKDNDLFRTIRFGSNDIMPSDTLEGFGLQDAQAYDSLLINEYRYFMDNIEQGMVVFGNRIVLPLQNESSLGLPAVSLLNVKYLMSVQLLNSPGWKLVYDKEIKIYQNMNFLPRAFMVHEARLAKNKQEILAALREKSFMPGRMVYLEEPSGAPVIPEEGEIHDDVRVSLYSSKEVDIDVAAAADGFLVLTDTYWPDWKAYVDGNETKIYKADYLFRAVPVRKGAHKVSFVFRPDWLKKYYLVAGMTFTGVILFMIGYVMTVTLKSPDRKKP